MNHLDDTSHGAIVVACNRIKAKLDQLADAARKRQSSGSLDELYRSLQPDDVKPIREAIDQIGLDEQATLAIQEAEALRVYEDAKRTRELHARYHVRPAAALPA